MLSIAINATGLCPYEVTNLHTLAKTDGLALFWEATYENARLHVTPDLPCPLSKRLRTPTGDRALNHYRESTLIERDEGTSPLHSSLPLIDQIRSFADSLQ